MRSGSVRIGLGGGEPSRDDAERALLEAAGESLVRAGGGAWSGMSFSLERAYGYVPDGKNGTRWVLRLKTGKMVKATESDGSLVEEEVQLEAVPGAVAVRDSMSGRVVPVSVSLSPKYIKILETRPTVQQPLPKVQETILTSDLKKQVDVWGFDTMTADDKTGAVVKKKNWEKSLGLPNWGADASIKDMAMWLLYLAAAGIAFVAIDFATKD